MTVGLLPRYILKSCMQTKTNPEDVQLYLTDASFIREGYAECVVFPESIEEVSEVLASANRA